MTDATSSETIKAVTTKERLLYEAELLVRRQGYAGFSYADLAAAVGIRTASIHYHFPTKDALGLALVAFYQDRYDAALAEILQQIPDTIGQITAYAELYRRGLQQNAGCLCAALAVEINMLPDAFRAAVAAFFKRHLIWLEKLVVAGVTGGELCASLSPSECASLILATLQGALLMERVLNDGRNFDDAVQGLIDCLKQ